jgi:hypothetical protein
VLLALAGSTAPSAALTSERCIMAISLKTLSTPEE